MSYAYIGASSLGSSKASSTITASVVDLTGTPLGSQPTGTVVNLGGGAFGVSIPAMPSGQSGWVLLQEAGTTLAALIVSPIESENTGAVLSPVTHAGATIPTVTTTTTTTNLTNLPSIPTDWIAASGVKADAVTKIQAGLATPTNITAGTITTVGTVGTTTNLTNAPTAGDFTATMKSSLNAATPTVTTSLGSTAPAGWINTAAFAAGATIPRVTLADTLTTYTGNTPQTGDAFARIGATGSGLTTLATAAGLSAIQAQTDLIPASPAAVGDPMTLDLAQAGLVPRALDAVADASLTVGDALVAAICGAAGKESIASTAYTVKTPSTGTAIRAFTLTLDALGQPTARD